MNLNDMARSVPGNMRWGPAAAQQFTHLRLFSEALGLPWDVVGSHTSKSIKLPVLRFSCSGAEVYLRDNFHDVNICVVAEAPITVSFRGLFEGILTPQDWDWYLTQIARCRNYSWAGWTDEEMDLPGLIALSNETPSYAVKSLREKARWAKRMTDPEWFYCDWSSDAISCEGEFGPGAQLWVQPHPYLEGISELATAEAAKPYTPGCKGFAISLNGLGEAEALLRRFINMGARNG